MLPVIRISDETWERLKGYARPLEDSAEDVVRLALDALDKCSNPATRQKEPKLRPLSSSQTKRENKLPQKEFRAPILLALAEKGGKASAKEIRELLEPRMKHLFSKGDYDLVSSGDPRWWNAVCWQRNDLVKEGMLRKDSIRGIWELSELGKQEATNLSDANSNTIKWRDDIRTAINTLDAGRGVSLSKIYPEVAKIRQNAGRSVPESLEATIRRTLEDNCAESDNFRGQDIFHMPMGKGAGVWSLRQNNLRNNA